MSGAADWRICLDFGTAYSKAAAAPVVDNLRESFARLRPLAIGAIAGEDSPFMAPCVVFLEENHVLFGAAALERARARAEEGREALQSFKTILGGRGALEGLSMRPSRHIDPQGLFTRRDLTVAYLGWLQHLAARALVAEIPPRGESEIAWRYTRPAWAPVFARDAEALVARLIDEGRMIAELLGDALLARAGIDHTVLAPALAAAATATLTSKVEACVLEPVAAAALSMGPADAFTRDHSAWVVLDMGAGTTDLAAVAFTQGAAREIAQARVGLSVAGDDIDRLIMEHVVLAARHLRSIPKKTMLWRKLLTQVRDTKAQLFTTGKTTLKVDGKPVTVQRSAIEHDRHFQQIRHTIADAFATSFAAAADSDAARAAGMVHVVVAGGGAGLKFIQEIAARGAVRGGPDVARMRRRVVRVGEEWQRAAAVTDISEATLPQLAIALGGAVAPASLLTQQ